VAECGGARRGVSRGGRECFWWRGRWPWPGVVSRRGAGWPLRARAAPGPLW